MRSRAPGSPGSIVPGARCVSRRRAAAGAALALLAEGCRSASDSSQVGRHFSGEIWGDAFVEQLDHASQWAPAAGFLLATPLVMIADDDLTEDSVQGIFTGGNTISGDFLSIGLGLTAVGFGVGQSITGEGDDSLEIGLESMALTSAATYLLKATTNRERPDGSANDSFPSAHTSFAFSAATYLARAIDDASDGSGDKLGYLFYIPAVYVGVDRVEGQRHWSSDVTFGAFLGILVANWVYNAHQDDGSGPDRPTIQASRKRVAWRVEPVFDGTGIAAGLSFGF